MRRNRHPADRLAEIREDIARLKREEAQVRSEILSMTDDGDVTGASHCATVRQVRRRRFSHDLLPAEYRDAPRFWTASTSVQVAVRPLGPPPRARIDTTPDFSLIEDM